MSREDHQMKIRLPADLKDSIDQAATANKRSLNAEIVRRLEDSFAPGKALPPTEQLLESLVPPDYLERMRISAAERGIPLFSEFLVRLQMYENFMASESALGEFSARLARSFASQLSVEEFTKLRNDIAHGVGTHGKANPTTTPAKTRHKTKSTENNS